MPLPPTQETARTEGMTSASSAKNFHAMGTRIEVGVRGLVSMVARIVRLARAWGSQSFEYLNRHPLLGLEHGALAGCLPAQPGLARCRCLLHGRSVRDRAPGGA